MTTFEEFARARYASLQQQRAELYAQLRVLQKEIEEIEKASKASGLQLVASQTQRPPANVEIPQKHNMTMKKAAVEILRKHPDGLPATIILVELNKMLGTNYERSSLSPQLSRLKREGTIYDVRGTWALVQETSK